MAFRVKVRVRFASAFEILKFYKGSEEIADFKFQFKVIAFPLTLYNHSL